MSQFNQAGLPYTKVLAKLHQQCFEKAWNEDAFASLLYLPTTRGFLSENAFVLFSVCDDQAEILTLGVLPEARKKGIAFELLTYAADELKKSGVKEIFLDVNVNNLPARKLYEKADFQQISVRKSYYDEGGKKADALVLKKIL